MNGDIGVSCTAPAAADPATVVVWLVMMRWLLTVLLVELRPVMFVNVLLP